MVDATDPNERDEFSKKLRLLDDKEKMPSQKDLQAFCNENELGVEVPKAVVFFPAERDKVVGRIKDKLQDKHPRARDAEILAAADAAAHNAMLLDTLLEVQQTQRRGCGSRGSPEHRG